MAKFIVLDGADGSGKGTQFNLLVERLKKENITFETADFPQHNKPSCYFVDRYLNGDYGTAMELGPYIPSILFAADRFDDGPRLRKILAEDTARLLISNRYVSANCGHQGGKISDKLERQKFLDWLFEFEYEIMRIPKPDLTLFLHVPADMAQGLVDKKGKETRAYITNGNRDIHEADLGHLEDAIDAFKYCAKKFSDWKQIDCVIDGKLLSVEVVHKKIWNAIKQYI